MILLDPRVGSKHLADEFDEIGADYELTPLDFADASFIGAGSDGPATIGVELKNIKDLVNSMQSGRLAGHQVPGLLERYQHVWLVVEGVYRQARENGVVEVPRGRGWAPLYTGRRPVFWQQVEAFLTSMEVLAGLHIRKTRTPRETAEFIQSLYGWWQKADHRSLKVVHRQAPRTELRKLDETTKQIRDIANTLPGIGYDRAMAIAKKLKSPSDLFLMTEREWREIDGVGRTLAQRIVAALHGEKARP